MQRSKLFTVVASIGTACAAIIGCSGDSPLASGEPVDSYAGPGSKWDVELYANNTFSITRAENASAPVDMTVEGSFVRAASGFNVLEVTSASGTGAPSQGDRAYALEVPGFAFILRPMDASSDQIIPMVESGACPQQSVDANWVLVKKANSADADDAGRDFFGTFNFNHASGVAQLPTKHALAGGFASLTPNGPMTSGGCSEGLMLVDDAQMYLTANAGAIVQTSVSDEAESSFIFALPIDVIGNVNNLDGNYSGLLFDKSAAQVTDRVAPVSLNCTAGSCTGNKVADVETGALDTESVTITLNGTPDSPSNGFITGTIGDGVLACMADLNAANSGRDVVSCVGQSPVTGEQAKMFNLLLVSRSTL